MRVGTGVTWVSPWHCEDPAPSGTASQDGVKGTSWELRLPTLLDGICLGTEGLLLLPPSPRLRGLCPTFPGFSVLQVTATDADSGLNQQLDYRIEGGGQDRFLIEATTGVIRVANITIDREERDSYRLAVVAVDQGTPALSGTATVTIVIDDINDCRPEFIKPIQSVSVPESAPPGTVVAEVTAIDRDLQPRLEYYLLGIVARDDTDALVPEQHGAFTVDFRTGRGAGRAARNPLLVSASTSLLCPEVGVRGTGRGCCPPPAALPRPALSSPPCVTHLPLLSCSQPAACVSVRVFSVVSPCRPCLPPSHPSPPAGVASLVGRGLLSLGRGTPAPSLGEQGALGAGDGLLWGRRARSSPRLFWDHKADPGKENTFVGKNRGQGCESC